MNFKSKIESAFYKISGSPEISTNIPYIVVENFPLMGLMTALRFLEWVKENPGGTISLPTGKTPEYFIKLMSSIPSVPDNITVSIIM